MSEKIGLDIRLAKGLIRQYMCICCVKKREMMFTAAHTGVLRWATVVTQKSTKAQFTLSLSNIEKETESNAEKMAYAACPIHQSRRKVMSAQ